MIQHSWDAESGTFCASCAGKRVAVSTPFGFFPLLTGRLPEEISSRLVEQLIDPHKFWPRYPVPTVALDDAKYNPSQMWRGPVWINVNYLLIEGLQRSGYSAIAAELRRRTLELVCSRDDIYEYYHPETGENPPLAATTFGWSAAMFIDLAIQASREQRAA
jgi:putative isomerase